jgi:hypothetical protein
LTDIEVTAVTIPCHVSSFDELWKPYLRSQGSPGAFIAGLSADRREVLRKAMRQNVLGDGPDGPFSLKAKAWAVKGVVP